MNPSKVCSNCNYYDKPTSECRVSAPTHGDHAWPMVKADTWCRQYRSQESQSLEPMPPGRPVKYDMVDLVRCYPNGIPKEAPVLMKDIHRTMGKVTGIGVTAARALVSRLVEDGMVERGVNSAGYPVYWFAVPEKLAPAATKDEY